MTNDFKDVQNTNDLLVSLPPLGQTAELPPLNVPHLVSLPDSSSSHPNRVNQNPDVEQKCSAAKDAPWQMHLQGATPAVLSLLAAGLPAAVFDDAVVIGSTEHNNDVETNVTRFSEAWLTLASVVVRCLSLSK